MIDRDEMRIARRTVERNGYTVLPPRERDEEDLSRYRTRRDMERRPARPIHDEDDYEERQPRFKPLRSRTVEEEPVRRPIRRPVEDDFEEEPIRRPVRKPVVRDYEEEDDYEPVRRPVRQTEPERKPLSDLERAKRTAEFNGYTVTKMSKLDQAKQVARDAGFEVRKAPKPTAATEPEETNDRPVRKPVRDGVPMRRPVADGIRTRTAPDVELKKDVPAPKAPVEEPKKPTFEDDYVKRAAAFFGDED